MLQILSQPKALKLFFRYAYKLGSGSASKPTSVSPNSPAIMTTVTGVLETIRGRLEKEEPLRMDAFMQLETAIAMAGIGTTTNPLCNLVTSMVKDLKKSAASLVSAPSLDKIDPLLVVCKCKFLFDIFLQSSYSIVFSLFLAARLKTEPGFNPSVEYAGEDATLEQPKNKACDLEQQPLWTPSLKASLTLLYDHCCLPVPGVLTSSRPASTMAEGSSQNSNSEMTTESKSEALPQETSETGESSTAL